ncbi:penicillin-binding protein 2 [bacterium]|nr:penicillin-binding protein 2 [bacterium]
MKQLRNPWEINRGRIRGLFYFTSALFLLLVFTLWYLQIFKGEEMRHLSESICIKLATIPPPRGLILDRNGRVIATNLKKYRILLIRKKVERESLQRLAQILKVPTSVLEDRIKKRAMFDVVELARDIPFDVLVRLEEALPYLPPIIIEEVNQRYYPHNSLAAHLIGYVGEISKEELESKKADGYQMGDIVGKTGLERLYEEKLRGEKGGQRIEIDVRGQIRRLLERLEPKSGEELRLTIDLDIQKAAEEALAGRRGAVVAMNPNTGEVLALASSPSFDPNIFASPQGNEKQRLALLKDKRHPFHNRAIGGVFPPGSIFKIITAVAGLEEKEISPYTTINCPGGLQVGRRFFRCWRRHGTVDFLTAVEQSCDTYFYRVGLLVGPEKLAEWARKFGLGEKTGIALPGEAEGFVADEEWKRKTFNEPWYAGDTANMAIGQGFTQLTPLQACRMVSAIANGGYLVRPIIVLGEKEEKIPIGISQSTIELIKEGMRRVVMNQRGTGVAARVAGISVGGKTGSAEDPPRKRTHAWFVCFAPVENPQIAVAVVVEEGGKGGSVAAPIAKKVLEAAFHLQTAKR